MILCIIVFFGASIWALVYTLRQEERKLELLQKQNEIDTYSPAALRDLRRWIEETPIDSDPDVQLARRPTTSALRPYGKVSTTSTAGRKTTL